MQAVHQTIDLQAISSKSVRNFQSCLAHNLSL